MRFRETGHFAKELREASGAGAKRIRRKRLPKVSLPCPHTGLIFEDGRCCQCGKQTRSD